MEEKYQTTPYINLENDVNQYCFHPDAPQQTDLEINALEDGSCSDYVIAVKAEESEIDIPIEQIHSIKGNLIARQI